jgi:hypothetical protein
MTIATAPNVSTSNRLPSLSEDAGESNVASHSEGAVAKAIENQTAKLPSDAFLWGAMGVAGLSCALHCSGDDRNSRFFGQWVAPLLIMGLYNKLVKVAGSDKQSGSKLASDQ